MIPAVGNWTRAQLSPTLLKSCILVLDFLQSIKDIHLILGVPCSIFKSLKQHGNKERTSCSLYMTTIQPPHTPAWGHWPPPPPSLFSRSLPSSQPPSLPGRCALLRARGHSPCSLGQSVTKCMQRQQGRALHPHIHTQQDKDSIHIHTHNRAEHSIHAHAHAHTQRKQADGAHFECDLWQTARTPDVEAEDGNPKIPFSFNCLFTSIELATVVYVLTTCIAPASNQGNRRLYFMFTRIHVHALAELRVLY